MAIGPFSTYAPPAVYTRTTIEAPLGATIGGLRVPVIVGTGQEALSQDNIELIRGSSSVADTPIFNEDMSGRWVTSGTNTNPTLGNQDGNLYKFRVRNYPIVNGNGTGTITFEAIKVSVTVNGSPVTVSIVDGQNGVITLLLAPQATDVVLVSYFFHRGDTQIVDTVSSQVTIGSAILIAGRTQTYSITTGTNDTFEIFVNDSTNVSTIVFVAGTAKTAADMASEVNAAAISGLTSSVHIDNQGFLRVQLNATGNLRIGSGNANGALGFNTGDNTARNRIFRTFNGPIVDGSGGGITTTDPTKVTAKINNVVVSVTAVDGANSNVTLAAAPVSGAIVTITYFFNTWQDTFDYLPNNNILEVGNVGISPGRRDFLNGPDFIVLNQGDQSVIQWGTSFQVTAGATTGATVFDSTQIIGLLVDNRIFATEAVRFTDPLTNQVSTTVWTLPLSPTTGNGRDTPLGTSLFQTVSNGRIDLPTNRPDLVIAYAGVDVRDALAKGPITVLAVDSATNRVTLRDPVPANLRVFTTFWYNTIADDNYTFTVVTPGPTGVGTYTVFSEVQQAGMLQVRFGTKTALPQTVQFPSGSEQVPDGIHFGGFPVPETITVTFSTQAATHASYVNDSPEPYDIYAAFSKFADIKIDGVSVNAGAGVDLATAFPAILMSAPVSTPAALVFLSTDRFVFEIDGYTFTSTDVSALTTLSTVATAINERTVIDLANELKADYNAHIASTTFHLIADVANPVVSVDATSLATAITLINELFTDYNAHITNGGGVYHPNTDVTNTATAALAATLNTAIDRANNLKAVLNFHHVQFNSLTNGTVHLTNDTVNKVSRPNAGLVAVSTLYAAEEVLRIKSPTTPAGFQDLSRVAIRVPVGSGETNAATKVGFVSNQIANGSFNSLNQAAFIVSGIGETYNIQTAVNDSFKFGIDGIDYTTTLAQNSATTALALVAYINASTASAADTATALASLILLANDERTQYTEHISNAGGAWHTVADGTNTITAPAATTLATAITLVNEIKIKYNAHRILVGGGPVHPFADTVNSVSSPASTDLPSAIILTNEIKAAFNRHRLENVAAGNVHAIDDIVEVVTAATVVFATPRAFAGTGQYLGKFAIRSLINTPQSVITVTDGNSNTVLGFTNNSSFFRFSPTAAYIASALNADGSATVVPPGGADAGFAAVAVAYALAVTGLGGFLNIKSRTAGSTSTILFAGATGSIFFDDTLIGIDIGDGDTGEATQSGYTVTSSDLVNGSSGTGIPGQTYTDARTGYRFTVLPASAGDYAAGGTFTFLISTTFTADSSIPRRAVPGVELSVLNTLNMGAGTTAIVATFRRQGAEPAVGDIYYISYKYAKTDLSVALFRDLKKIQQNFGSPVPENPLSLAARLALLNGAVLVGLSQVLRVPGQGQASAASYVTAIDALQKPMAGGIKPDVIVPLTTDTLVFAALNQHCIFMGSPRQEGERIGVIGTAVGTTPLGVQAIAQGLQSELMVVMYPDSYVITVTDSQGNQLDQVIDGSFIASAMAGSSCSPSLDVATPWTRRQLQGFKRIGRILDPTEANQVAVAGVTVVEQVDSNLRIRQGLTTNLANVFTRTPSVITTIHYVMQTIRAVLDPFIGQKFTGASVKSVEDSMRGAFQNMIDAEIVAKVGEINAVQDEVDPTILRAEAVYVPIFPLEYIVVSLSIRIRL